MDRLSRVLADWLGRPSALLLAGIVPVLVWAVLGPWSHYSDTWQLVINTGTTVLTYLFMFMIQRSQNANSLALHLKIDELIRSNTAARNAFIALENRPEADMQKMRHEPS